MGTTDPEGYDHDLSRTTEGALIEMSELASDRPENFRSITVVAALVAVPLLTPPASTTRSVGIVDVEAKTLSLSLGVARM